MRCEMDRGTLADMLAVVVTALPSRTTYPVLQNVLLEVAGGKLAVSGTDLDTYVRKECVLSGKSEDGKTLLPGRKLLEMVREIGAESVLLYSKNGNIHIEAGKSRVFFTGLDPAEFPELPKLPEGAALEFPVAAVLELFGGVDFAVSRDDSRPAMCGVNWEVAKTEMRMIATDGHRLALVRRKGKYPATSKMIVSPKVFSFLPRGADTVAVHFDPGRVGMQSADTLVIGRPMEGPYPDYERVIPKKAGSRAVLETEVFGPALRRATVLAHPVGKLVALDFAEGRVKIQAETPDLGSSEEEVPCEYKGDAMRIGFNGAYLLEIMRRLDGEKIVLELQSPLSAGLVKPAEPKPETEETYLLMPIRLD